MGWSTQLKSPPKINLCVVKLEKLVKNFFINDTSSQLGAYILANIKGTLYNEPVTITNLPLYHFGHYSHRTGCFYL